jgi:hypothetical protein
MTDATMVNFKAAGDLSFLVGMQLSSVQLGKFIVHFTFAEGCQVSTENSFEHRSRESTSRFDVYGPAKDLTVYSLLEERVNQVMLVSEDALEVSFSNGERLRFFANGRGGSFSASTINEIVLVD